MTVPVLFLDTASRHDESVEHEIALATIKQLIDALRYLRKVNKKLSLNCAEPIANCSVAENWTLQAALGGNSYREEWDFIRQLVDRSPFHAGFESWLNAIAGFDFRTKKNQIPSAALTWANILSTGTVSLKAHIDWFEAWVDAECDELDDEGNVSTSTHRIRNINQTTHVDEHGEWLRTLGYAKTPTAREIWEEKEGRFPGLRFLSRVRKDIEAIASSGAPYIQALDALQDLNQDIQKWEAETPWPSFSRLASPESKTRSAYCLVHDELTTRDESFEWHIRFTGSFPGRIHFRVSPHERKAVIAYIGFKLNGPIAA